MQGCFPQFRVGCLLLSCLATCFSAFAAEIPSAWIDDAQLQDVKSVGSKLALAVGEHGAIWKSVDGGRNWTESHCGMDVSLQSICLLDDRTGWVAGRNTTSYSGLDNGVLLATQDGGKTWQQLARDVLPALSYVKFFGLEEGLVVGQPTSGEGFKVKQHIAGKPCAFSNRKWASSLACRDVFPSWVVSNFTHRNFSRRDSARSVRSACCRMTRAGWSAMAV